VGHCADIVIGIPVLKADGAPAAEQQGRYRTGDAVTNGVLSFHFRFFLLDGFIEVKITISSKKTSGSRICKAKESLPKEDRGRITPRGGCVKNVKTNQYENPSIHAEWDVAGPTRTPV
jgi:hypothetical protein